MSIKHAIGGFMIRMYLMFWWLFEMPKIWYIIYQDRYHALPQFLETDEAILQSPKLWLGIHLMQTGIVLHMLAPTIYPNYEEHETREILWKLREPFKAVLFMPANSERICRYTTPLSVSSRQMQRT